MQDRNLLSLRKRLKNRGYTEIHIKQARDSLGNKKRDFFVVTAKEPLSGSVVTTEKSVIELNCLMR